MIIGIDPGLANTGWGIVEESRLVACGVLKTKLTDGSASRLEKIYEELEDIIKKHEVKELAYESLFFAKNVTSGIKVAEAIGVIKLCGRRCGLEVFGYTPLQVKMALVGYGRAEKEQVEMMVRTLLNLEETISPSHASDAVAVALTHAGRMRV